jgi:hypothetical protein
LPPSLHKLLLLQSNEYNSLSSCHIIYHEPLVLLIYRAFLYVHFQRQ